MCYALGSLDTYDGIYDIKSIEMTIFQPKRENISTLTISKEDLFAWAKGKLKGIAYSLNNLQKIRTTFVPRAGYKFIVRHCP